MKFNKNNTRSAILSFCFLMVTTQLLGLNIYVSPYGNDKNNGSKSAPLLSLTGVRDKIRDIRRNKKLNEPIRIIIESGTYYMKAPLEFTTEDAGTERYPITYTGDEKNKPVFIGGIEIKGFKKINSGLWKVNIPQVASGQFYFEQLYVNGDRAARAVSPNNGFYSIKQVNETDLDAAVNKPEMPQAQQQIILDNPDAIRSLQGILKNEYKDALVTFYHKWSTTIKPVTRIDNNSNSFTIEGGKMALSNKLDSITKFKIENFKAALDTANEWFLERSGELYYIPKPGETIENTTFYAPVINQFIRIDGKDRSNQVHHLFFKNLNFKVTGYQFPAMGFESTQAASQVEAVCMVNFANNISFINCEIANTGISAFWFRKACHHCTVQHCYIQDIGASGVKIGDFEPGNDVDHITNNITIDNNIISNGGNVFPEAVGVIIFDGYENNIAHNDIKDFKYTGVSVGWVWGYDNSPSKRNKIIYNHIHHIGWGVLSDLGGIYTLGLSEGTTLANNVIHHIYSSTYGGWGLYTDEGSTGITLENNLVYKCKSNGFHQHYGKENILRNNIFANNQIAQIALTRPENHLSFSFTSNIIYFNSGTLVSGNWEKAKVNFDNNCYWATRKDSIRFGKDNFKDWQGKGHDLHSIIADPLFVDAEQFDFRFKSNSVVNQINFKVQDYTISGVYGDEAWKKKALLSVEKIKSFDKIMHSL